MADKKKQKTAKYDQMTIGDSTYNTLLTDKFKNREPFKHQKSGDITAFIPGTIDDINIKEGEKVEKGQILLILEAMKMRNRIIAPFSGTVKSLKVKTGDIVSKNQLLIILR
jgi:pyruvate carboxylase subunit B